MVTLDTNVVLRILYNDDPAQAALAASAWQKGLESGGIFLTTTVLVELAWVLRVAAKFDRSAIAAALQRLCDSQGSTVQEEATVRRALQRYATGLADFSDYLILEIASGAGALPVITFDQRFAREPDVEMAALVAHT
jgi:predicted nucleic-acid-binding protein